MPVSVSNVRSPWRSANFTRWFFFFLIAILGTIGDLVTKQLTATLNPTDIIHGALAIRPVLNKGIIWGLFQQGSILFLIIPALAIPLIIMMFKFKQAYLFSEQENAGNPSVQLTRLDLMLTFAFGLILAGALGNLYDRIIYHGVRDFIDFHLINWPIFNLADAYITIGAALIILSLFVPKKKPQPLPAAPAVPAGIQDTPAKPADKSQEVAL